MYVCVSFILSHKSLETQGRGAGDLTRKRKYIRFIKYDDDDDGGGGGFGGDDDDKDDDDDDDDDYQG